MLELLKTKFGKDILPRTASALVLAPLALYVVWQGGVPLYGLLTLVLILGLHEWIRMTTPLPAARILFVASLTAFVPVLVWVLFNPMLVFVPVLLGFGFIWLWLFARRVGCDLPWVTALGMPYLSLSLVGLHVLLMSAPEEGQARELVLFLVLAVWAVDIGAYFSGRLIGGAKLAPKWSPNKTWAGLIGGMLAAGLAGLAWAFACEAESPAVAFMIATLLGGVAQIGDIGESVLKRTFGVKDSGRLLPGHGGVLDRVDGFLLALPVFAAFQYGVASLVEWW